MTKTEKREAICELKKKYNIVFSVHRDDCNSLNPPRVTIAFLIEKGTNGNKPIAAGMSIASVEDAPRKGKGRAIAAGRALVAAALKSDLKKKSIDKGLKAAISKITKSSFTQLRLIQDGIPASFGKYYFHNEDCD